MLTLYHGANSVCSVKVRIVLAEKGLEWNSRHIDLPKGEHLGEDYLKINPRAGRRCPTRSGCARRST